jgi:hypothetical protein
MFKPQLGAAAAVIFLAMRRWKVVVAATVAAALQLLIASIYYGSSALREWMRTLFAVFNSIPVLEPKLYQSHSLRSFWPPLIPSTQVSLAFYVLSTAAILGLAVACWRSRLPLSVRYSALLLATVLVSPHLIVYDLVILAPAILFLAEWLAAQPHDALISGMATLLCLVYLSPLLGPLSLWTHLQLSVLAMAGLVWMVWQVSRRGALAIAA